MMFALIYVFWATVSTVYSFSTRVSSFSFKISQLRSKHFSNLVYSSTVSPSIVNINEFDKDSFCELNDELKTSFMSYAMSTILSRALPDARDGLKPVHRRVLYAMQVLNLTPDSTYRKCARIVGEVLGKFHPHGDQSVYDALVRMAQDFVLSNTLVAGHGNFGSVDNDPPAAMRYTEAKLSALAFEALLADIKENTVDFTSNFDGNEQEPVVLPARFPVLVQRMLMLCSNLLIISSAFVQLRICSCSMERPVLPSEWQLIFRPTILES